MKHIQFSLHLSPLLDQSANQSKSLRPQDMIDALIFCWFVCLVGLLIDQLIDREGVINEMIIMIHDPQSCTHNEFEMRAEQCHQREKMYRECINTIIPQQLSGLGLQSLCTGSVLFWLSNFGQVLSHIVATWSQHSQLFLASFYHQLFFDFPVSRNIV